MLFFNHVCFFKSENNNNNNHAEVLIGELLSITNDDDNNEFDYTEDERLLAVRASSLRQLQICTELLELLELPHARLW